MTASEEVFDMSGIFRPANLRRAFFGLLVLGIVRGSERLVTFFYFPDSSMFSISVPQLAVLAPP